MNNKLQTNKIRKIINNNVILDDLSISKIEFQLQQLEYVVRENQQLKDRIDKAIEYIDFVIPCIHDEELLDDLLEILKGAKDEWKH